MEFKKNILVVDDDPDVVAVIKGILHSGEYEIQSVCRGREVFARLEEKRPDLIILDIKMPEMDGFQVLKRLKASPETSSSPVILLTGKGQYQDVLTGYELGTDYYMNKPFTGSQLINGIDLFLGDGNPQKTVSESVS
jgi:DNA-binding response OmpR family regulator